MNQIIRIAVAEDQGLFRQCFIGRLRETDTFHITCEAGDGQELLDKLRGADHLPDIVLLDLNMPRLNGVETTKQLRQSYPELKIIILSVYTEAQYIAGMVNHGVHGYLSKSAQLAEVQSAIRQTYESGFYFNADTLRAMQAGMTGKHPKNISLNKADALTPREKEVLQMICGEYTTTEIAEKLFISKRTAEGHRNNLLLKTGCRNTAGLVLFALKHRILGGAPGELL